MNPKDANRIVRYLEEKDNQALTLFYCPWLEEWLRSESDEELKQRIQVLLEPLHKDPYDR